MGEIYAEGEVGSTYEVTSRPPVLARCAATAWVRTRARVRVRVRVKVGVKASPNPDPNPKPNPDPSPNPNPNPKTNLVSLALERLGAVRS